MKMRSLALVDAFEVVPDQHRDERGVFVEWFRPDLLGDFVGGVPQVGQANLSVSRRGAIRGLHLTRTPPGQAKYLGCLHGAIADVLVDLRVGSPTYGRHETVRLDDTDRHLVYVPEGFGHGFCALSESATVSYLCSTVYDPDRECVLNPLDPELGISWPVEEPTLSAAAAAGPGLRELVDDGLLPAYADCHRLPG
jgi:dTDP-4-dehydrorhamnose 3,5-epimerase